METPTLTGMRLGPTAAALSSLELISAVRTYARRSTDRTLWPAAAWTDEEMRKVIGRCYTLTGAIRFVRQELQKQSGSAAAPEVPRFSVVDKFTMLEEISHMVMTGRNKAMVVAGGGGTGKSFTVLSVLRQLGLTEVVMSSEDAEKVDAEDTTLFKPENTYIKVTGSVSPMGLYRLLYTHADGGKLVFDDCDAALGSPSAIDILKGVLDTSGDGTVSWHSPSIVNAGLPTSFTFKGKVVFITNKAINTLPQPILSRGLIINMELDKREIVERARMLDDTLLPHLTPQQREELFSFVEENLSQIRNVTLRLFTLASPFLEAGKKNWKQLLLFTNPAT